MNLRELIETKYKEAIKSKNLDKTNTYRLIKSAIKDKDIESRTKGSKEEVNDQQILSLLQNLIKQRKDSIDSFKSASREDLINKEKSEIEIISQFLPMQLDENQTNEIIKKIIDDNGFSSLKDMGSLMNNLKAKHSGSIDMALAGKIAKSLLGN